MRFLYYLGYTLLFYVYNLAIKREMKNRERRTGPVEILSRFCLDLVNTEIQLK